MFRGILLASAVTAMLGTVLATHADAGWIARRTVVAKSRASVTQSRTVIVLPSRADIAASRNFGNYSGANFNNNFGNFNNNSNNSWSWGYRPPNYQWSYRPDTGWGFNNTGGWGWGFGN